MNALDSPERHLDQRINERLQLALRPTLAFRARIARLGEHHRPEVHRVDKLPVVDLLICLL